MVKCPWCGEEVSTGEYSKHYDICPKRTQPETKKEREEWLKEIKKGEADLRRRGATPPFTYKCAKCIFVSEDRESFIDHLIRYGHNIGYIA